MDWLDKQVPPVPQERLVALGPGERREIAARMELPAYKGTPEKQGQLVHKVLKVPLGPGERREIAARMELPAYKGTPEKQGQLVHKVLKVQQAQQGSKAKEEKLER